MHNLPNDPADASALPPQRPKGFLGKLREALTPIEDQWTFTTESGETFEEVDVLAVEGEEVVFRHRFGEVRMPIAQLNEDSRHRLAQGFRPADPSSKPATAAQPGDVAPAPPGSGAAKPILFQPPSLGLR